MKIVETLTKVLGVPLAIAAFGIGSALAQTSPGTSPSGGASPTPPAQVKPDMPSTAPPATKPSGADADSDASPSAADKSAAAPNGKPGDMVGLPVVGSDGKAIGSVTEVKSESDGKVKELSVKTGTILGFGGTIVKIPADKIAGSTTKEVKLSMTFDQFKQLMNTSVQ